jgi:hypothetical protein
MEQGERSWKVPLLVIPAEVPRRARDPEFTEGAGIQFTWRVSKHLDSGVHRSDGLFICRYVSCRVSSASSCSDVMILKRGKRTFLR